MREAFGQSNRCIIKLSCSVGLLFVCIVQTKQKKTKEKKETKQQIGDLENEKKCGIRVYSVPSWLMRQSTQRKDLCRLDEDKSSFQYSRSAYSFHCHSLAVHCIPFHADEAFRRHVWLVDQSRKGCDGTTGSFAVVGRGRGTGAIGDSRHESGRARRKKTTKRRSVHRRKGAGTDKGIINETQEYTHVLYVIRR